LIEIGIVYLIASIIIDFLLGAYQILIWPVLGFIFVFFAAMIVGVVWDPTLREPAEYVPQPNTREDDLARLQSLCEAAVDQGNESAKRLLSQRISSLTFAAAAHHLKMPESTLRNMAEQEPFRLRTKIEDQRILHTLTTHDNIISKGDWKTLDDYLNRVEAWTR
jgi:hypothetical protein